MDDRAARSPPEPVQSGFLRLAPILNRADGMKLSSRLAVLAVLALSVLVLAPRPSNAAVGWSVSGAFSVGPFDFDVYYQAGRYGHHYYRAREQLHYHGVSCSDACFYRAGYDYHHASCPVVGFHFRRYGFHPARLLEPLFYPRYRSYSDDPYRGHGYRSYGRHHDRGPSTYGHRGHDRYCDHGYGRYDRHRNDRYDRDWDSDSDSDRRHYRRRHYDRDRDSDSDSDRRRHRARRTRP